MMAYIYNTIEEAQMGLQTAQMDCEGDFGEDAVEAGWNDLVRAIADQCPDKIGQELIRRNL